MFCALDVNSGANEKLTEAREGEETRSEAVDISEEAEGGDVKSETET